jgi:putative MATE family efflux protein
MRTGNMPEVLARLGIPTMVGMMVSALYSVVDAYFVGGLGTSQMGAIAVVFPVVQVIVGLGMTFGSGAASYIARMLGKGDAQAANHTAATALYTSLAVGAVAILLSLAHLDRILTALGATSTILPYARAYASIYIAGSILNVFNITMNNIITAEGRSTLTMVSMCIGGGLNVVLDPLFIYPLGFGIRGAAIATVISQVATACLYFWYIGCKKGYLRFAPSLFSFDKTIFMEIFKVGVPILVFQLLTSISLGLSNTAATTYGDSAVAAVGVVTRILTLGTYVIFGYMKGYQPVVGYNYGAGRNDRVRQATKLSLLWSTVFCIVAAGLMLIIPKQIINLFTTGDADLSTIGAHMLWANGLVFPLFGFQMVTMALFLAMGKGKEGGILSISRQGLFFVPAILLLPHFFGVNGIIWAQPVADAATDILAIILVLRLHKELSATSKDNLKKAMSTNSDTTV